jgi:hypothetical protein
MGVNPVVSRRMMQRILAVILFVVAAALLIDARWRGIDPDELEHLHAACAVSWGEIPYRDFFEHHTPGVYYLLQPVLWVSGADLPAIWFGRLIMGVISLATLVVTGLLARRTSERTAAWAAPTLLLCTTIFFAKAIEIRPDVPAALLLTMTAWVLLKFRQSSPRLAALLTGVLLAAATLFTQKAIVPAAAMIVAQAVLPDRGQRLASWLRTVACTAAGFALIWATAAAMFWTVGGAAAFWQSTVYQLWRWPVRISPLSALRPTLLADLALWIGAAAAIGWCLILGRRLTKPRHRERLFLALTVALAFLGGLAIQAAYSQYYLLWFPLAAVVAADAIVRWGSGAVNVNWCRVFPLVLLAAVYAEWTFAARAIQLGQAGALPHLLTVCSPSLVAASFGVALGVLAIAALVCLVRGHRGAAVFCLVVIAFGHASLRNIDTCCWSNAAQLSAIEQVNREVGPNETIFDGYTGFGVFRHHAYYYWWLNPYSLRLMDAADRNENLLAALRRSPPQIVCLDDNVQTLPAPVLDWIKKHYSLLAAPIYIRREASRPRARTAANPAPYP